MADEFQHETAGVPSIGAPSKFVGVVMPSLFCSIFQNWLSAQAAKFPTAEVNHSLTDFRLGVHNKGALTNDGLIN